MRFQLEYVMLRIIQRLAVALSLKTVQRLGKILGAGGYYLIGSRRRIALDNLRHAFPEKSHGQLTRIAKGSFRNYGITMMEFLWFPKLTDEHLARFVKVKNEDLLRKGMSPGKGMVMLSGHFGNWELIAFAVAFLHKMPITIIVQTQSNKLVNDAINAQRCLRGNKVIPMGISVREIIHTLNNGGVVAIAPDQSGPAEGVFVEFFGRRVATHQGPSAFALRNSAPLKIGFMIRQPDGTYEVQMEDIPFEDLSGSNEENVSELTRRHTAMLEHYIRRYPDHWLWMHRRWKHTWESVQAEKESLKKLHA